MKCQRIVRKMLMQKRLPTKRWEALKIIVIIPAECDLLILCAAYVLLNFVIAKRKNNHSMFFSDSTISIFASLKFITRLTNSAKANESETAIT